uniref:Uncharacterized protein n=1 Tax=Panagrolaimus sp. JU765 TaxID=591449 RepID=A0AC34QV13_9BILA
MKFLLVYFYVLILLFSTAKSISLEESFIIRREMHHELHKPHILPGTDRYGGSNLSPVLLLDHFDGTVRVLNPRPAISLDEMFAVAQKRFRNAKNGGTSEDPPAISLDEMFSVAQKRFRNAKNGDSFNVEPDTSGFGNHW